MAVLRESESTKLILKVETGTTASGGTAYAQRSISHINPEISDADMLSIGEGIGELQVYPVSGLIRQDTAMLVSE